jgi:transposase
MYSIIETCKLNKIDPQRYLLYVLERIAEHLINRIEELLPAKYTQLGNSA